MKHHISTLALLLCANLAYGTNTIKGVFSYTKRAPEASIIYIESDKEVEPVTIRVNQVNKEFSENIVIAPAGSKITFDNSDTVQHNVFASDSAAGIEFDSKLSDPGNSADMDVNWSDNTFISVGCKIHPKMRLWVGNLKSQHVAVAEFAKGELNKEVSLEGVPAEAQSIKVWIPRFDSAVVDIAPGESKTIDLTRKGKTYGSLELTFD
ncbi:MAG: hypothetical protein ACPGN3_14440 [Opitutales bacterium]